MWLFLLREHKQAFIAESWAVQLIDLILILLQLPGVVVQTACDLSGVSRLNSVHFGSVGDKLRSEQFQM